jgi:hypothetical protein
MVEIRKIYYNEKETELTVEFFINSKLRKKGSELLSIILESIISNSFSRETEVEPKWIYDATKKLESNNSKVECFFFFYEIKGRKSSNIAIGARY